LRVDSKTDSFKKLYASRAPVIEGVFAESKQWHSLGRAWRRGLSKMKVQCLLVATVLNFKRLMGVFRWLLSLLGGLRTNVRHIWAIPTSNLHAERSRPGTHLVTTQL
jgi:hypothetical protein